jgi:DNA-binding transcriptional regulator GbsR (MarR family)
MILEAEDNYFSLYTSIFNKLKSHTIKDKLKRLSRIFTEDDGKRDIIEDRRQLKNILKTQRPQRESK